MAMLSSCDDDGKTSPTFLCRLYNTFTYAAAATNHQRVIRPDSSQLRAELRHPVVAHRRLVSHLAQMHPQPTEPSVGDHHEKCIPREHARYVCDPFAQLGVRGVRILANGSFGIGKGGYVTNDGSVQFMTVFSTTWTCCIIFSVWRCLCVTSVSGTTDYKPEIAASLSGRSSSNYFQRVGYKNRRPRPPSSGTSATDIKASTTSPTSPRAGYRIPDLPHSVEVVTSGTSGPHRGKYNIALLDGYSLFPPRLPQPPGRMTVAPWSSMISWSAQNWVATLMDSPPMLDRVLLGLGTPDFDLIWTYLIFERF
ncbi:hypothetical protein BJY52DRAFT_1200236 [Lactarius psammicola]|nr:hypothetical protein BJY52DRAFT_1200236 [Lactarius psammicola]